MDTLTGKPSDLSPTPLLIFQSELALIEAETLRWPDRETGGELFGYFTYAGWPVVHRVVNANGSARRGSATFHPDARQIDAQGRDLIDNYGLQHLGQWHSHHRFSLTHPSGVDRSTVADAIRKYRLSSFVQVIANVRPKGRKEGAIAHAYFYGAQAADQCDTMRWLVLPGTSPVSALSGMDVALTSAIQLEPSVVAWDELRGQTPVESAKAPISDPTFLQRLQEELKALHAAGFVARGRPEGRCLRIDALRGGERYSALLAPEYPTVPPELCQAADEGAPVAIEAAWAPDRRLVDVFAGSDTPLSSPKPLFSLRGAPSVQEAFPQLLSEPSNGSLQRSWNLVAREFGVEESEPVDMSPVGGDGRIAVGLSAEFVHAFPQFCIKLLAGVPVCGYDVGNGMWRIAPLRSEGRDERGERSLQGLRLLNRLGEIMMGSDEPSATDELRRTLAEWTSGGLDLRQLSRLAWGIHAFDVSYAVAQLEDMVDAEL